MKEAEAIEQQMRAKGGSVPPSGGPQVLFWSYLVDTINHVRCRFQPQPFSMVDSLNMVVSPSMAVNLKEDSSTTEQAALFGWRSHNWVSGEVHLAVFMLICAYPINLATLRVCSSLGLLSQEYILSNV